MSKVAVNGTQIGNNLQQLMACADIVPGDEPSYQLCKITYEFHPLGSKMVDAPIRLAQSQERKITVSDSPEDRVRDAFIEEWTKIGADRAIASGTRLARIYGVGSLAILTEGEKPDEPLDFAKLAKQKIAISAFDPLNTAGSLVLNQDPNALDFQKHEGIAVSGVKYHRSRSCTIMNEEPIYISYTTSAFGFVGRSVYQRALYPLKSFINSMITDDMVVRKAGLLVAMMEQPGSIVDNPMMRLFGIKRNVLKEAETNNVISVGVDEKIETLNMQNLDGAYGMARGNLLKNIATAGDMPAVVIENETLAEGFGEGTEDAKTIARFVDRIRIDMAPFYVLMDKVVQHRAWNEDFYKTIQADFPEYKDVSYTAAFTKWQRSFKAVWPSLLKEPDSELILVDDVNLKAIIAMIEVLGPGLDPANKATLYEWGADNFNELRLLFSSPLVLDYDALLEYEPPVPLQEPGQPKPFAAADSEPRLRVRRAIDSYNDAVKNLTRPKVAA